MRRWISTSLVSAVILALAVVSLGSAAHAQRKGEYLTEGELDLVRDIQLIDARTEIFLKVADRRLTAMVDPAGPTGESRMKKYGPLPTGTAVELLDDYRRTVEELMIKLDDEFERTAMTPPLKKALELSVKEIDRQLGVLAGLAARSNEPAYVSFHRRAVEAASELRDGAREALAAKP